MEREDYRPRLIDNIIDSYLEAFGAVCVGGTEVVWKKPGHHHIIVKVKLCLAIQMVISRIDNWRR